MVRGVSLVCLPLASWPAALDSDPGGASSLLVSRALRASPSGLPCLHIHPVAEC